MIVRRTHSRLRVITRTGAFLLNQRLGKLSGPGAPALDPVSLLRFKRELASASAYLEYGSGGSTLLADRAGIPTVTIESDRFYADKVREFLSPKTKVKIIAPSMGLTRHWGWPVFNASRKGHRYVSAPFSSLHGRFPDFILVDGRYRTACALEVARRAFEEGATAILMLDDYSDRTDYHALEEFLGAPEMAGRAAIFELGQQPVPDHAVGAHIGNPR